MKAKWNKMFAGMMLLFATAVGCRATVEPSAPAAVTNEVASPAVVVAAATTNEVTPPAAVSGEIIIANWNVENLFDADDDPDNPGDDEYTPRSDAGKGGKGSWWRDWTLERYEKKLGNLAELIAAMKPDVLCLEEVENRRVLVDLCAKLKVRGVDFPTNNILHQESTDFRGIDCAILSRVPAQAVSFVRPFDGMRDSIVATFDFDGAPVSVVASHWKSQIGDKAQNDEKRAKQAACIRKEIDRLLGSSKGKAAIVVTGDFNDNFTCAPMVEVALLSTNRTAVLADESGRLFYNLSTDLPIEKTGTHYYKGNNTWSSFDSISVTRGMLDGTAPWVVAGSDAYEVYRHPKHVAQEGDYAHITPGTPRPFRRISLKGQAKKSAYSYGYSDHFPVRVKLRRAVSKPD